MLLDDLTPEPLRRAGEPAETDLLREFWLNDPRLIATEVLVTPAHAVILARRVGAG